jgi:tetratricopeptide (TPR) repeat protein
MDMLSKIESINKTKVILVILGVGFFVYFNSLFNGFVWDDEEEILNNQVVHQISNIGYIWNGGTFNTGGTGQLSGWFFRPIRTLTIMVNWAIFGPNAGGWHLVQVLFHLINTYLFFRLLYKLLEKTKYPLIISSILSLLFVVHPAINEAIVYIAASSEVMYSFCNLLVLNLLIYSDEKEKKMFKQVIIFFLLLAGLLIKESSIIILPLIGIYLLFDKHKQIKTWLATSGLVVFGYLVLRFLIVKTPLRPLGLSPISEASLGERLLTVPAILLYYLKTFFFPKDLAISQHFIVKTMNFNDFFLPLTIVCLFFGILFFLAYKWKSKLIFWGLIWYLSGMVLILNIFPLDMTVGDRWLYFPVMGLILVLAGVCSEMEKNHIKLLVVSCWLVVLTIPLFGCRSIIRNTNWRDGLTLYAHDSTAMGESFDIENNLGVELFRVGKIEEAKPHFEKSIELNQKWHFAYNNLGVVYERAGNLLKARELYEKTISMSDYYLAYENLGFNLLKTGKKGEALTFLSESVLKLPLNSKLRAALAIALYKEGKQKEAEKEARNAYGLESSAQNEYILETILKKNPLK